MVFCFHLTNNYVGVFVSIVVNFFVFTHGFNLETRLPLVKQGHPGSYFGYSLASHQIRNVNGTIAEGLLLVGAPLDQNLQPGTNRSGALWKCPLTNFAGDCEQVVTDGRRDVDIDDLFSPGDDEIKDGQWLGVTVRSQGPGEKVLVCAHRYVSDTNWCRGLCYVLKQDLEFDNTKEPCRGLSIADGHVNYGMCSSGTSGMIFEDDNVIIGSPGSLNWRGAITVFNVADDMFSKNRDKGTFTGPPSPWGSVKKDSYLGMSVTGGYFIGDNITVFVAGAPRSNETGQVILFVKSQKGTTDNNWREYLIINGEQIASNFGYQVASADVNGDKLPDLIVAAPFYFNAKTEEGGAVYVYMNHPVNHLSDSYTLKLTGKMESRFGFAISSMGDLNKDGFEDIAIGAPYEEKGGAVYIYLGSANGLLKQPSQIIRAEAFTPKYSISTFGYSLSGGIDLDENGYPDLLVGAYEKDSVILLRARPIIGFNTFVQPHYNLTNIDPNARNCLVNNTNYISCFSFETCCKIDSLVKTYKNRNLLIKYQLEAEVFERKTSRIWFDNFYNKNHTINRELNITNSSLEFCQRHTAYLKENTLDIQSPIKIRMSYKLIHKEPERVSGRDLPHLDNYPILNQQQAERIFNATFLKDCGSDDICESQLHVSVDLQLEHLALEPHQYQLVLGERRSLLMNVSVHNVGESAYQTQLYVQFPKQVSFNKVSSLRGGTNQYICHSTLDTYRICMLGNPLKQNERVNLQLEFDLENVNGSESSLEFKVVVNTTSIDLNNNNATDPLKLRVVVVEKTMLSITGHSIPEEIPEMQNTELKGESAIKFKEEIGSKVTHYYTIYNNGAWNVANLLVEIEWPFQVANNKEQGKWLLYMDEFPVVEGGPGRCEISPSEVNPLKYRDGRPEELVANYTLNDFRPSAGDKSNFPEKVDSTSNAKYNRVKRDTEMIVRAETYNNDGKKYRVVKMNCVLNSAKCRKFSCYLDLIESKESTKIVIKSRLWDATLIEDYADVDQIKIASRAKMHIPRSRVTLPNLYSDEFQVETNARVNIRGQQPTAPIPLFFIIAAIFIGLLLFILLTLLLWKLGFFKRRRPDPTLSGNLEKHRLEDS